MNQSNNVHLRWNKHQTTLLSVFDGLLDSEKLTDCTISAEGRNLRGHKIILSACSPYFEKLFTENYEKHPIIILHDVKYNIVKALIDFMYRGEVDVPQEELSVVLKLSESLQIRGLSRSLCVDNVNMQEDSGSSVPSVPPETLPSQPASASRLSSGQNEPEENVQSTRVNSPGVSSQDEVSVHVDSIPKVPRKCGKRINHSGSDKEAGPNVFEGVVNPDLHSLHQLPVQSQVLPTTRNSTGGPVYSPTSQQPASSELQSTGRDMAVAENRHVSLPEAVLPNEKSANVSVDQHEVLLEAKCEVLETDVEILNDIDDNDYSGDYDYRDVCSSTKVCSGEAKRLNKGLTGEDIFHTQENDNLHSPVGGDYMDNMTLTTPQTVYGKQYSCPSCGSSYRYASGLWRHMKHQCGKEPQFQCSQCSYRCSRTDTLKRHMYHVHHLV